MRILSKFKDYYDHAMGFGQDPNLVYVREFDEESFLLDSSYNRLALRKFQSVRLEQLLKCSEKFYVRDSSGKWFDANNCFLIVAGKLYPGLYFDGEYYFSIEKLLALKESLIKKGFKDGWAYGRIQAIIEQITLQRYRSRSVRGEYITIPVDYFYDECVQFNTPCVLIEVNSYRVEIKYNVCLKEHGFAQTLDAFTCFQEMEMFMGQVKTNQLEKLPDVEDKYKIMEHGFDEKSFRPGSRG